VGAIGPGPSKAEHCQTDGRCTRALFQQWGGTHTYQAGNVTFDSVGNVYTTSNRGVGKLKSLNKGFGYFDVGLTKWTAGAEAEWARYWGTPGYDGEIDLFVNTKDELLLLASATEASSTGSANGATSIQIATLSKQGADVATNQWEGGPNADTPNGMQIDRDGVSIAFGATAAVVDGKIQTWAPEDVFLQRTAADGTRWTCRWGTTKKDYVSDFALDKTGNIYVAGHTEGAFPTFTFGGRHDAYIAKISASGTLLWVKQWGGELYDSVSGIELIGEHLYIAGGTPSNGLTRRNVYVTQMDLEANVIWTKELPANTDTPNVVLGASDSGKLYVVFDSEAEDLPNRIKRSSYASDLYLTEWDASGNVRWLFTWGSESHDYAFELATYKNRVAVVGRGQDSFPGFSAGEGAFLTLFDIDP
jgi:hypothetical protein